MSKLFQAHFKDTLAAVKTHVGLYKEVHLSKNYRDIIAFCPSKNQPYRMMCSQFSMKSEDIYRAYLNISQTTGKSGDNWLTVPVAPQGNTQRIRQNIYRRSRVDQAKNF